MNKPHEAKCWIYAFSVAMGRTLHKPCRRWFKKILFGVLLACSTVSSWICAVEEQRRYQKFYHHLGRLGKQTSTIQEEFGEWLIKYMRPVLSQGGHICLAVGLSRRKNEPMERLLKRLDHREHLSRPTSI